MCKRIFASQTNSDGEVPFFKIGTIGGVPDSYISSGLFEDYKRRFNFPVVGEVLITCSGTVGRCLQYDGSPAYYQDSNIVWLHGDKSPIESGFLYWLLKRHDWKTLNTTTISRIYSSDLLNLKLSFPTAKEQEKITHFLILIDRRIAVQNKIIEAYGSLINPLFNVLNACEKKKISLGELGVYRSADNLSWDEISGKGDPTIIYGELFTTYQLIARDIKSLSDVQIASTSSGRDILFPASTTVDSLSLISPVALYEKGVKLGGDMFFISLKEEYDPLYISLLLNLYCKRALSKYAQGSTIIHLHFEDIENFTIFVPDAKKQREISTRILHILDLIDCERKKLKLLLKQKQFFLNELFI